MAIFAVGKEAATGPLIALGKPSAAVGAAVVFGKVVTGPTILVAMSMENTESSVAYGPPTFIEGLSFSYTPTETGTYELVGSIYMAVSQYRGAVWSISCWNPALVQWQYPPGTPASGYAFAGGHDYPFDSTISLTAGVTYTFRMALQSDYYSPNAVVIGGSFNLVKP